MRVVMLTSAPMPPTEGIGHYVFNLSRYLRDEGHRVQIITRGGSAALMRQENEGISIWKPRFLPLYPFHVHLHGYFVRRLVKRLEGDVDLFHLHSPLVPHLSKECPCLLTIHTPMYSGVRAFPVQNLTSLLGRFQLPVSIALEKACLSRAREVSVVASSVASELGTYGVPYNKVHVVGNAVDADLFYPVREKNLQAMYIFTAGRLGFCKGYDDLIEAAAIVKQTIPSIEFRIAGGGILEKRLRRKIQDLGLEENVKLLGHVPNRESMIQLYQKATLYVHSSHYEGLPTALLEAMSCGRPVISTSVSGALDVIEDGKNGVLVPAKDATRMAAMIISLLKDSSWREAIGREARRTIKAGYSWSIIGRKYIDLYRKILGKVT